MTRRETKSGRFRGTTLPIEVAAVELRQSDRGTLAEQVLWKALRGRALLGLKFRRQHPVGPYILDFFCPAARLVAEVDGDVHDEQIAYDAARTLHLNAYGYRVVRFRNEEVLSDLPAVLNTIAHAASQPASAAPDPAPAELNLQSAKPHPLPLSRVREREPGGVRDTTPTRSRQPHD